MILGFLKGFYVNGSRKLTKFKEKILSGIKIHTIREDANNRWIPGRVIHFATGVRSSLYNCFKMGVCISTQSIEIVDRRVFIDCIVLREQGIERLAKNDGFDSVEDFWAWFDDYSPFSGKVIHWTDYRYRANTT